MVGGLVAKASGLVLDCAHQPALVEPAAATLKDYSRFGNDGAITGATWVRLPSGLWYLSFNGAGDKVDCGDKPCFHFGTRSFSIEAWIKMPSDGTGTILGKWAGGVGRFTFAASLRRVRLYIYGAGGNYITSHEDAIDPDIWTYVAAVRNTLLQTMKVYVNAVEHGTIDEATLNNVVPAAVSFTIGQNIGGLGDFKGDMAYWRVSKGIPASGQLLEHYIAERAWFGV